MERQKSSTERTSPTGSAQCLILPSCTRSLTTSLYLSYHSLNAPMKLSLSVTVMPFASSSRFRDALYLGVLREIPADDEHLVERSHPCASLSYGHDACPPNPGGFDRRWLCLPINKKAAGTCPAAEFLFYSAAQSDSRHHVHCVCKYSKLIRLIANNRDVGSLDGCSLDRCLYLCIQK